MVASTCAIDDSPVSVTPGRDRPPIDPSICSHCQRRKNQKANPRSVMPKGHALETTQAILIERLDNMLGDVERIVNEEAADALPDDGTRQTAAIRIIQALQVCFFPSAFEDGEPCQPDPAGRQKVPPPAGLLRNLPTLAIYARYLERGKKSPAAKLTISNPDVKPGQSRAVVPLFKDADLIRLAERQEMREMREARGLTAAV